MAAHLAPGTHLACMGTGAGGEQGVEPVMVARSRLFTDEVAQSVSIGGAQHAVAKGGDIVTLGGVLAGLKPGRQSASEIMLFDGTGVALRDPAVAARAVARARERGQGVMVQV